MPRSSSRRLLPEATARKRRWTEKEGWEALSALERSGLSIPEFAAQTGVDTWRLYQWRKRLKKRAQKSAPVFVEIKGASTTRIEVELRSGQVVRVAGGFDEETFRRVVAVLEERETAC